MPKEQLKRRLAKTKTILSEKKGGIRDESLVSNL